jgi:glycerophosphoryl diester phosphodiesterase
MDYLVELARHPDILEAIKLAIKNESDESEPVASLRRVGFLATEYPNAWIVEVVHQFYAHPEFASGVWAKVRSDPPTFLKDLIANEKLTPEQRNERIRTLLKDPKAVRDAAAKQKIAVSFSMVQEGELEQIHSNRELDHIDSNRATLETTTESDSKTPLCHSARAALDRHLFGLAFSGGGIRSATFNLGVLQTLAKIGVLKHVDYLSTVSGGGYIGTWLAGWIRRELDAAQERGGTKGSGSKPLEFEVMAEIQRRLSPVRSPNPMDEHVKPIRFLREYSNYLTPKTGFLSSDTWTMIGIYVRNTLLNQVIIVSLFAAALLIPRNWFALSAFLSRYLIFVFVAVALWGLGAIFLIRNLRRLDPRRGDNAAATESKTTVGGEEPPRYARPWVIHIAVVLPWLLACALVVVPLGEWALWSGDQFGFECERWPATHPNINTAALGLGAFVALSFIVILWAGQTSRCWTDINTGVKSWPKTKAFLAVVGSSIVAGAVSASLTWLLLHFVLLVNQSGIVELRWHLNAIVIPGLMSVLSLAIVALLGMLGKQFPDEHREWWSRLRTVIHIYAIAWLAWFLVAVYVPWFIQIMNANGLGLKSGLVALATWLGSTLLGVKLGPKAEGKRKQESESAAAPSLSATMLRYAVLIAPYVFVVGVVVGISLAIDALYRYNAPLDKLKPYWEFATWTTGTCWMWTVACAFIGVLFSWRVNINEFSIHHFYKNRLVRCYLGASHVNRKADWFTGFDPNDDQPLREFDHAKNEEDHKSKYAGPYPIINCALNLIAGQDLAWQERKATSFVFTPKYCGYDVDRAVLNKSHLSSDGYVPTKAFYHDDEGPLFGMAMAISGAAANPNMGRASSPALSFLMTVFNVRLGWWIGNPRHRAGASMPGPRFGLTYTALELFGGTNDNRKYVNLSDGGHFDNLGVYELIRRNCRYIMVCDAGQDPKFICEDLGDLVRRCRTDFGVEIDIAVDRIRQLSTAGLSQTHCVVGVIHYLHLPRRDKNDRLIGEDGGPLRFGCRPDHEKGYLIYLKPSMTGDEPQDVLEYQRRIPEFPHQSTADQWFGESQFESYRKLGVHIAQDTFARYQEDDTQAIGNVGRLFERLYHYWYPPSAAIGQRSSELADEYSRIMEMVRTTPKLKGLDRALFEDFGSTDQKVKPRDEFYICNALIQLIENVYADLNLENNWNHPHVEGWMKVFKRWARQPEFRRTWKISEGTYAERFRNFYNDRLRGNGLGLPRGFVASHRGRVKASLGKAGNTLEDFERAINAGASMIELDVRQLADGNLIVCHDDKIGGKEIAMTTLDDLKSLSLPALTLDRCLEHLEGKIRLDLELKVPGIESDVIHALKTHKWRLSDVMLTSFDKDFVKAALAVSREVVVGILVEHRDDYVKLLDDFFRENEADFLAPEESFLTQKDLKRAEDDRVPLVPWTVNNEARLRMFLSHAAVAGVITENVEDALRITSEPHPSSSR